MLDQSVSGIQGIVTAVASTLFYMQQATGDGDPNTSDAIVVYTITTPTVQIGNLVSVSGTVSEFTPGGTNTRNLSTTQISSPTINIVSIDNPLPAPIVIGPGGRLLPTKSMQTGVTFFESLEGMLVTIPRVQVVEGTNKKGEIFAIIGQGMDFDTTNTGRSSRGTIYITPNDFNPERIQIDPDPTISKGIIIPDVSVGSILSDITGVVAYDDGNFEIVPTQKMSVTESISPPKTILNQSLTSYTLTIGTFNVMNLDPNDSDGDYDVEHGRFKSVARTIVDMGGPDVVGLQGVQDNTGSTNDGMISASFTLQKLIGEIKAIKPNLSYQYIDNTFIANNKNGGERGGNSRTAFLYNPSRVTFTDEKIRLLLPLTSRTIQLMHFTIPVFHSRRNFFSSGNRSKLLIFIGRPKRMVHQSWALYNHSKQSKKIRMSMAVLQNVEINRMSFALMLSENQTQSF
jgi:uncharacterized protein